MPLNMIETLLKGLSGSPPAVFEAAFGKLFQDQVETLAPFVRNKVVHDLGAGNLALSKALLSMGARQVIAVDKEAVKGVHDQRTQAVPQRIQVVQRYFAQYQEPIDTAFVSWPANNVSSDNALVKLLRRAERVIYLGKNTDHSMCGTPVLFGHLVCRKLLAYAPQRENTLIVYGPLINKARQLKGEELAALTTVERVWFYDEVERCPSSK